MMDDVLELIRARSFCVLATSGEDGPRCSLMSYAADDGGRTLYMVTLETSHKWRNLTRRPRVSLLIDDRADGTATGEPIRALTLWGEASRTSEEEDEAVRSLLRSTHPDLAGILDDRGSKVFQVRPAAYLFLAGPREERYGSFEEPS
jgi:nitroimidazol reductase NimA-like FMN-containing flavoprotein (pyridoxamine 5'-phosphate oxidase superfamily)